MKILKLIVLVCACGLNFANGLSPEDTELTQATCCSHGETVAVFLKTKSECSSAGLPEYILEEEEEVCKESVKSCCENQFKQKDECAAGIKLAPDKRCSTVKSEIGKVCCEECSIGRVTGALHRQEDCGSPADSDLSPSTILRKNAYYECCLEVANTPETTTEKKVETTTQKKVEKCKKGSCQHICDDSDGKVTCSCQYGYRLKKDKKSCKDINECAEAIDDLCTKENTVCHNIPGSFKCVPVKKRDVSLTCPPGFKRNVMNQVCDDINECQLPRPPCPKYLCENTIGGYKCAGKPGKPVTEAAPGAATPAPVETTPKNDICPAGFRAGPDDECIDIDECEETKDDCQRLSQFCINTHGSFFCQNHVSKHCAPGFKANRVTGICEDIDECEESSEVCKRNEVCVNLPGAYDCKSKISTLPKLNPPSKNCQEGLRMRPGGSTCEDIDECREGTHLCDQFQNCINTFGGHECRCKNGFELDSATSACTDIDECALKMDNCKPGTRCNNVLGSYNCLRGAAPPAPTPVPSPSPPPGYEYEYYDSDDENTTDPQPSPRPPSTPARPTSPPYRPPTTIPVEVTTSTTTEPPKPDVAVPSPDIPKPPPLPPRPDEIPSPAPLPPTPAPTPKPRPYTNRPNYRPRRPRPSTTEQTSTSTTVRPEFNEPATTPKEDNNIDNEGEIVCLYGLEKNSRGECVDIDECEKGVHVCSNLEYCVNKKNGYYCECKNGFYRAASGWCVASNSVPGSPRPTTAEIPTTALTPTMEVTRPTPVTPRTTVRSRPSYPEATTSTTLPPHWGYNPFGRRPYSPPTACELGYTFDFEAGKCVDIDECATNRARCSSSERCINTPGGYRCVYNTPTYDRPSYERPNYGAPRPREPGVITVGAQFGQRGARVLRPTTTRLPATGAVLASCPWGYELTRDHRCLDVDECSVNSTACGHEQRCENFPGGYSCQCPAGHQLHEQRGCKDIDECAYTNHCPYNAECVNTVGSYRCVCGAGFRNAASNDKVCVDVDECSDAPGACQHECANSWGSYRCYCRAGYRAGADNNTCEDIDECKEYSNNRLRGKLCRGECVNQPGSYSCSCPAGYRLADDRRSCIDIDECETGEASCARSSDPGTVCQNTRGSYHCHTISCPPGYRLEGKHRCTRIQRMCQYSDLGCLQQPSSYSYNFITFVSNIYLENGAQDLFTMHGPNWRDSIFNFEMRLLDVEASRGVQPADLSCFDMRPNDNVCVISLLCSLAGPQVAELELTMSLYQRGNFAGSAVARLVVIVSAYEY